MPSLPQGPEGGALATVPGASNPILPDQPALPEVPPGHEGMKGGSGATASDIGNAPSPLPAEKAEDQEGCDATLDKCGGQV